MDPQREEHLARAKRDEFRFTASWYANDTIYHVREFTVGSLIKIMAALPPADTAVHDWAQIEAPDPGRGVAFLVIFQRKQTGRGHKDWFLYQIEKRTL